MWPSVKKFQLKQKAQSGNCTTHSKMSKAEKYLLTLVYCANFVQFLWKVYYKTYHKYRHWQVAMRLYQAAMAILYKAAIRLHRYQVVTAIPRKLYGYTKLDTQVPVRTLKLSNGYHLDGWSFKVGRGCCSYKYCKIPEAEKWDLYYLGWGQKKWYIIINIVVFLFECIRA